MLLSGGIPFTAGCGRRGSSSRLRQTTGSIGGIDTTESCRTTAFVVRHAPGSMNSGPASGGTPRRSARDRPRSWCRTPFAPRRPAQQCRDRRTWCGCCAEPMTTSDATSAPEVQRSVFSSQPAQRLLPSEPLLFRWEPGCRGDPCLRLASCSGVSATAPEIVPLVAFGDRQVPIAGPRAALAIPRAGAPPWRLPPALERA